MPKCKICKAPTKFRACSPECAIALVKQDKEKKVAKVERLEAKAEREKRIAIKPRSYWMAKAQQAVNQYVRLRDRKEGCVSCDRPATWQGQWHASHFRSVGAASAIRFNLWNISKSCSICNNWKSGNLSEYEPRLRAKIGDVKVDWLRSQTQSATYSIEYLQRLVKIFRKKVKRLTR